MARGQRIVADRVTFLADEVITASARLGTGRLAHTASAPTQQTRQAGRRATPASAIVEDKIVDACGAEEDFNMATSSGSPCGRGTPRRIRSNGA